MRPAQPASGRWCRFLRQKCAALWGNWREWEEEEEGERLMERGGGKEREEWGESEKERVGGGGRRDGIKEWGKGKWGW